MGESIRAEMVSLFIRTNLEIRKTGKRRFWKTQARCNAGMCLAFGMVWGKVLATVVASFLESEFGRLDVLRAGGKPG